MLSDFRATEKYYGGFQKLKLFSDEVFRATLFIFLITSALYTLAYPFLTGPQRVFASLLIQLLVVFPLTVKLCGGMTGRSILWFCLFCLFSVLGLAPPLLGGSPLFLAFIPVAGFCFVMLNKKAPWIMRRFGFPDRAPVFSEIGFILLNSFVTIFVSYYALNRVKGYTFHVLPPEKYIYEFFIGLIDYGLFFGLVYGILFRRLLDMKFELTAPITLNVMFMFINWAPVVIGDSNPVATMMGQFASSILVHFTFGISFYFCRSPRMALISFLIYFMFYKSMIL